MSNGKGSSRRPEDTVKVRENWDKVFGCSHPNAHYIPVASSHMYRCPDCAWMGKQDPRRK